MPAWNEMGITDFTMGKGAVNMLKVLLWWNEVRIFLQQNNSQQMFPIIC